MIEALLYSITALIVINAAAVLVAIWVAFQGGQVERYKQAYWRAKLEAARKETNDD